MAETKNVIKREYVIPLRKEWNKVARYKRTARSVKEIKRFIAKHMKVPDRDTEKVKLDVYLNNELWFRGCKKPPAKIKVLAKKEGDIVIVELVDVPDIVKFRKLRDEKRHKKVDKKKSSDVGTTGKEEGKEKKGLEDKVETDEQKKEDLEEKKEQKEKAKSGEDMQIKVAEKMARAEKHTVGEKPSKAPLQRKALKK
jgi:ribosomal protein L31E